MSSNITNTDLAVLGGGPGGYAAAFMGADLGLQTSLIDLDVNPGGVCLYRGCIPSKALLHVAKLLHEAREATHIGITFGQPQLDLDRLRAWKTEVVSQMTGGLGQLSKQRKVNYIQGRGMLIDPSTIEVAAADGSKQIVIARHIILATGSRPIVLPGMPTDSPLIMDSTGALDLPDIPERLLVVGGNYIGLELGSVYAALGSQVTVCEMLPHIAPGTDRDLVRVLVKRLEQDFHAILIGTKAAGMKIENGKVHVTFDGENLAEKEMTFDRVLVAIGRRPNSENLGLENTKIELDQRGHVKVDEQMRTAEPTIFAIGDLVGDPKLAHKATHEGRVAAQVIAGHKVAFEPHAIPAVVYTDPELATVGLTETQAKAQGREVAVARFPWAASGRATTQDRNDGLTKLIIDPETERVLGMGIVGPGAGELIAEGTLAIEMAALASDVGLTIHPHPTLSESVMEAADVFYGESTHLYRPRRDRKKT